MEKAAIDEHFVVRRFEEMSSRLVLVYEVEDRAESLRYCLIVERMAPILKINGKEISQVPG